MFMDFYNAILTVLKSIRIQDVLDVAIISTMIFVLMMWFKARASRYVLIGIILLGGVYMAARFFQLYLTVIVLHGFFAILLFVLVVIFQEDLRVFFTRLALLGNLRNKTRPLSEWEKTTQIIVQTATSLSQKRVGALIVVQGEDPLERHLNGGTKLDGLVSQPLLESIFDPHSIGHDGAVIIKGDLVRKFGCHLPLSVNIEPYGNIGLRHTAALGLSERSDAICVVVSEERGTISLAKGEILKVIPNASALEEALEDHYNRTTHAGKPKQALTWLKENTSEKIIALGLACILWVAFGYQRDIVRRDFLIPVEYKNIPQNWQIDKPEVAVAKVILQGPQQAFPLLSEKNLKISLDLSTISEKKQDFTITPDMVNTPSNVKILEISPPKMSILASRRIPMSLPVSVSTRNSLPEGYSLQKITIFPFSAQVLVDSRKKPEQIRLKTEPIDLQRITSSTTLDTRVAPIAGVAFPNGEPPRIRVFIKIKKNPTHVR